MTVARYGLVEAPCDHQAMVLQSLSPFGRGTLMTGSYGDSDSNYGVLQGMPGAKSSQKI